MDSPRSGRPAPRAEPLPDDATLVEGLRARDESVFTRVVMAWTPTMTHIARSHVSTADSAAEVVQDTWLAVLRGIDGFEGRSRLRTWVFRILTNTAKSRGVRESRSVPWEALVPGTAQTTFERSRFRGPDEDDPGHWLSFPAPWPSLESEVLGAEVRSRVDAAVRSLPERQRVVIMLRDIEGFSSDEVCAVLSISAANQRVLLHRARTTVRARLEAYFGREARWGATT